MAASGPGSASAGEPDTDLYALLHVPREASDDDLRRAYRNLAAVYHPDKYQTPQMQAVATENFQRIRRAFEVLSDAQQRQVYDLYGSEGLSSGLELGPRLKSPREIREEMERQQGRQQEMRRAAHTNHSGSLLMSVTVAETLRSFREPPKISTMQMGTQVQAGLSGKDLLVLGGNMVARRGVGGGTVHAVWKRTLSPHASFEVLAMTGLRSLLSVSTARQLTQRVNASMGVTCHLPDGALSLSHSWTRQLSAATSGTIHLNLGAETGVGVGWQHQLPKGSVSADVKLGESMAGISGTYVRRFSEQSQGRVTAKIGSHGIDVEVGGSRRISEHSSAGWFCTIGLQGVVWKLRYTRGGQKFVLPIVLATSLQPTIAMGALMVPSALYWALKVWVLKPYAVRRRRRKELQQRRANAEQVREARDAAFRAQHLLEAPSERKRRQQLDRDGLLITSALYGNLQPDGPPSANGAAADEEEEEDLPPPFLDVRIPLQFFVEDAGGPDAFLLLHEGIRKRGLMGFCDPCPGEDKMLRVEYSFRGQPHKVVVGDFEELRIPQERHRIVESLRSDSVNQVD